MSDLHLLLLGQLDHQGATVRTVRVRYFAVCYRTLTSLYDENKLCISYLQRNFHKSQHWMCHWFSKTQTIKTT